MDFLGDKFQMLKWFRKEFPNTISKRTLPMASTGSSPMSACSLFPCTSRITCFCFWMHTCRSWFQMYPAILTIIPAVLWHQTPICFLFAWNFGGASTRTSGWPLGMPLFYCCVSFWDLEKMLSAKNPHSFQ